LDPSQTAFFGALNVPTKITRGRIEILANVKLVNKGESISRSMETFLGILGLRPFSRVVTIEAVYDKGNVWSYAQYIRPNMPLEAFLNSVFRFAAISAALVFCFSLLWKCLCCFVCFVLFLGISFSLEMSLYVCMEWCVCVCFCVCFVPFFFSLETSVVF